MKVFVNGLDFTDTYKRVEVSYVKDKTLPKVVLYTDTGYLFGDLGEGTLDTLHIILKHESDLIPNPQKDLFACLQ